MLKLTTAIVTSFVFLHTNPVFAQSDTLELSQNTFVIDGITEAEAIALLLDTNIVDLEAVENELINSVYLIKVHLDQIERKGIYNHLEAQSQNSLPPVVRDIMDESEAQGSLRYSLELYQSNQSFLRNTFQNIIRTSIEVENILLDRVKISTRGHEKIDAKFKFVEESLSGFLERENSLSEDFTNIEQSANEIDPNPNKDEILANIQWIRTKLQDKRKNVSKLIEHIENYKNSALNLLQ